MLSECSITWKVDFVNSSFQITQEILITYKSFFSPSACLFIHLLPTLTKHLLCLRYELDTKEGNGKTTPPTNNM